MAAVGLAVALVSLLALTAHAQRTHCKEGGWSQFLNSCGIELVRARLQRAVRLFCCRAAHPILATLTCPSLPCPIWRNPQSDLVPPHYYISDEAVRDKICIKSQVPRDCADDIQAYLRLFDTCPVRVRSEDPNFKAVSSMQTAADTCGAATLVLGAVAAAVVALNMLAVANRV